VLKDLINLTKPGIIRLNLIAAFGGYWVASKWDIDWLLLIWTLLGTTLTIASSCVINNYLDRDWDIKMERTQNRPLPAGRISPSFVLGFGIALGIAGLSILFLLVDPLCGWLGLLGMFVYIVIYTLWLKRHSTWSTSVGGISGAMPPVIGYCAVTGEIDAGAWLLFALLFLWQPPHFWSLSIRRVEEYRAAGFPLLPVVKGVERTKRQMIPYVLLLIPAGVLLYATGYAGVLFLIVSVAFGAVWSWHTIAGMRARDDTAWAKQNFMLSVNYLMVVFLVMVVNTQGDGAWLP